MAETPNLPAPITLKQGKIIDLVKEIVHDFKELDDILAEYGLTREQYEHLKVNPFFAKILSSETASWQASGNAQERSKAKSAILVEQLLDTFHARLSNRAESLDEVVKGMQVLMKIAGIGERVNQLAENAPKDKFVIQINMGGQEVTYAKDKALTPPKIIEGESHAIPDEPIRIFVDPTPRNSFFLGGD